MKKVTFRKVPGRYGRDWDVLVNKQVVGELNHAFTSPGHKRETFSPDHHVAYLPTTQYAKRRGWWTSVSLDRYLGLSSSGNRERKARYLQFPLYELKALVKHAITNDIQLRDLTPKEVIALAQHCRAMELAKKRSPK